MDQFHQKHPSKKHDGFLQLSSSEMTRPYGQGLLTIGFPKIIRPYQTLISGGGGIVRVGEIFQARPHPVNQKPPSTPPQFAFKKSTQPNLIPPLPIFVKTQKVVKFLDLPNHTHNRKTWILDIYIYKCNISSLFFCFRWIDRHHLFVPHKSCKIQV